MSFDEEPVAAAPVADLGTAEEPVAAEALPVADDEITLPAADAEADALDWLAEPAPGKPPVEAESLDDIEFGEEEVVAAEPIVESDEPEELAPLAPPAAASDDDFMNWLEEPEPRAAHSEVESLESMSFDEEPVAAAPLADLGTAEEPVAAEALPVADDEITLPAADADALEWLTEPAPGTPRAEAEPLGDIEFGEEAIAAEPIVEDAEPEAFAPLAPPAAASDDDFMNWLEEPEPRAAHSEVESLESMSFDEEPVPAAPLADLGTAEEPVAAEALPVADDEITLPVADADALDWLAEPAPGKPPVEAESLDDIEFGEEEVVAAEPVVEDAEPEAFAPLAPPAAASDDDFMNWLEEPEPARVHSEVESLESMSFDEEPVPAAPLADLGTAEEPVAAEALPVADGEITLPAADAEADALDWLAEPAPGKPPVEAESLDDIEFGEEEVVAAEPIVEDAEPEQFASPAPPAVASDDDFMNWLDEPAPPAAPAEAALPESVGFDEEPFAAEPLGELGMTEEPFAAEALPAADAEADALDWLAEPAPGTPRAEAEPLGDIEFGEEAIAAEPIVEDAEPEAFAPPAAASEDDFMNWLDEPAPPVAPAEAALPESVGFDEEPFAGEPLGELGMTEEPFAAEALPAADAEADALDWLAEPAPGTPRAEAEPLGDIEFGEEAIAAEPIVEDTEPEAFASPAAASEDDFMNWLDEPALPACAG